MSLKKLFNTLLVPAALCLLTNIAIAGPLAIGAKAPSSTVKMEGVDGSQHTITSAVGKLGTLVVFTCNHCPYVKAWEKRIAEIGAEAQRLGIGVILINSNDPAEYPEDNLDGMKARAKSLGLRFPYVVDSTSNVAREFGATKTPEVYLFDKSGSLAYQGAVDDNSSDANAVKQAYLKNAIAALAAGQAPAPATTKTVGCGIKFRPAKS
jgi:hypothetical protein